jgi:hypothetical protein
MDTQIGRVKGAWVLWMLRTLLGEPLFSELLAEPAAREDLRRSVARAVTGAARPTSTQPSDRAGDRTPAWVDAFFDFWVHGTGLPDYRLGWARARARDGGFEVTLHVENRGTGAFSAPAVVQTEEGARHIFPISVPAGASAQVAYTLLTRPVAAAIDPEGSILAASPPRGWETVRTKRWWIF